MQTGVLLINVGSPEAPTTPALRNYLRQFLSDPRVLDIPALSRWLLLHGIILRFRPKKSAHAYSQIWTSEGSPLIANTRAFANALARELGNEYHVEYAMAVGNPSIADRLQALLDKPLRELIVLPLFPQYASATTGGAIENVLRNLAPRLNIPPLRTITSFFNHPEYLNAVAEISAPVLQSLKPDHVLFSYHGLPEHQIRKAETTPGHCLSSQDECCAEYGTKNLFCYRAQCFATTRLLVERLQLAPGSYSMSFQSRLGRTAWIQPYTEEALLSLAQRGVKKLAVLTPSFVADCLETLEEIGIRGTETFRAAGGERLDLIPAPNAADSWIKAAASILKNR